MVYVFLANGFEITEALAPVDMLRRAGVSTLTVGIGSQRVVSSCNIEVKADILPEEMDLTKCEMVVLPGGMPGSENLLHSPVVDKVLYFAAENGIYAAAICAAPMVLGLKGMLKGKNATCFPGFEDKLLGASLVGDGVCTDGKIITAKGAGKSIEFGLALVEALKGRECALEIKGKIQC